MQGATSGRRTSQLAVTAELPGMQGELGVAWCPTRGGWGYRSDNAARLRVRAFVFT